MVVSAISDEQLAESMEKYAEDLSITPLYSAHLETPTGDEAIISLVLLDFIVIEEGTRMRMSNVNYYVSYKGIRHFADSNFPKTTQQFPSGVCEVEDPDGGCGVESVVFYIFNYDLTTENRYNYKFSLNFEPSTGLLREGSVNEIVTSIALENEKIARGEKYALEDNAVENVEVPLTVVNQAGYLTQSIILYPSTVGG